jgi:DNA-directed RNA polymerase subunit beta'
LNIRDFSALRISLASPEQIRAWSHGEVTKPETINYRRLRPEKDGLFCEAIFGPTKDWQCYCGKYKQVRYRGIVCDRCGVEVTRSSVRRERMGHIELAAPVAHIWYTRRVPSHLGLLLDISRRNLDRVLYFAQYVITKVDEGARGKALRRLDEDLAREQIRLEKATQERIDEVSLNLAEEIEKVEEAGEATTRRLDEQLGSAIESVMKEAQTLQGKIESRQDKKVRAPLVFSPSSVTIVEKGEEVVGRKHLTLLNEVVQSRLSEIKAEIETAQENNRILIEAQVDQLRHAAEKEIEAQEDKLAQQLEHFRAVAEANRAEMMSLAPLQFLNEASYRELEKKWGHVFTAKMGAEAFYDILKDMDLNAMAKELRVEIRTTRSKQVRKKATKRLRVVEAFRQSGNRPEWMILTVLPVIPPDLRPMVQLDGGRFATSDLNDLYRRVINRNNRLKRLLELGAPGVIVRNEKRMLQEAVDSLIDNSRRGKAVSARGRRQLKSLSDMLKGKQGRFRRNLLGKRVDYSGRSVIVIGPHLELHQCGLPKGMALELFRPFVIRKLVEYNYAANVKGAKRIVEQARPEVWEVLEEVIKERPVLLNRAPTLHRLGIQAFEAVLVEGSAIQIHPLVCAAFNADFDGDQMAVHIPLSKAAIEEARNLMLSTKNLLLPASGEPIVSPSKDMVLGCYYLTMDREGCRGEGKVFADLEEVGLAYDLGKVDLHASIKVHQVTSKPTRRKSPIETTVGRALFNEVLPEELRFVNEVMDKNKLKNLIAQCYKQIGPVETAKFVDKIKDIGFKYATQSGLTIAVSDITVPEAKAEILEKVTDEVNAVEHQYRRGLITEDEQYVKTVELWTRATDEITEAVAQSLDPTGPIRAMAVSGATKGGFQPIRQLAGMRGLMADPSGRIIALPIRSNFREGLTALEYFISTHGARKGLADTALRTADAGYLTRRLVDVAQDIIINTQDCGTRAGIWVRGWDASRGNAGLAQRVLGRIAAASVVAPGDGQPIVEAGQMIEEEQAQAIEKAGIEKVYVRSPLACELRYGVCVMCYGRNLARGEPVKIGEAVGIIAAQSIGEPGTQLTLRTFHTGGVAGMSDITHGLPRVQELFEARSPKGEAIVSDIDGVAEIIHQDGLRRIRVVFSEVFEDKYDIKYGWKILVEDGDELEAGAPLASRGKREIVATTGGKASRDDRQIVIRYERREEREYEVPSAARLLVENGQRIVAGQQLTEGSLNPHRILRILGREATQSYLLEEIQKVYRSQGVNINDKHIEMIIRQMLKKVRVVSPGGTTFLLGELVNRLVFADVNAKVAMAGEQPATAQPVLLGITKAALNTDSFLSAASFQHTINVLANAAVEGKTDELLGLKENVIIGKLIPAGTGFRDREKTRLAARAEEEESMKAADLSLTDKVSFSNEEFEDALEEERVPEEV